jgi:hypothetical protein
VSPKPGHASFVRRQAPGDGLTWLRRGTVSDGMAVARLLRTRPRSVDLFADDGISNARRVADPHGVNVACWRTLCDRVLYARKGTSVAG